MTRPFFPWLAALAIAMAPGLAPAQSAARPLDTRTYIDVAHKVLPSVVNIAIERRPGAELSPEQKEMEQLLDHFRRERMRQGFEPTPDVSGSGVVIELRDGKGYVLTNNHVVEQVNPTRALRLRFHSRPEGSTEYSRTVEVTGEGVRVLGRDSLSDLAVIEFSVPPGLALEPVRFADSDKVEIGEHVIALGNPLDLNHTVSQGIISAKARFLGTQISLERLLQTDATIQPGSSGGPLVNLDGDIIGINNAIASRNGLWQGIGFAIPSNDAARISRQLIDYQRVIRGYLGVNMGAAGLLAAEQLAAYGLDRPEGVYVQNVVANSPADVAGIHVGDIVVAIDGAPVRTPDEMLRTIASKDVNTEVQVEVVRLDEARQPARIPVVAKLTERPDETIINEIHSPEQGGSIVPEFIGEPDAPVRNLGLEMVPFSSRERRLWGLEVTGVAPGSPAAQQGMAPGDIVTTINGRSVRSLSDFMAAIAQPVRGNHVIRFRRGEEQRVAIIRGAGPIGEEAPNP